MTGVTGLLMGVLIMACFIWAIMMFADRQNAKPTTFVIAMTPLVVIGLLNGGFAFFAPTSDDLSFFIGSAISFFLAVLLSYLHMMVVFGSPRPRNWIGINSGSVIQRHLIDPSWTTDQITEWCRANCRGRWRIMTNKVIFGNTDEAVLFSLTACEIL
jgi:hypothetical protein